MQASGTLQACFSIDPVIHYQHGEPCSKHFVIQDVKCRSTFETGSNLVKDFKDCVSKLKCLRFSNIQEDLNALTSIDSAQKS